MVKYQSISTESGHVAYQIDGDEDLNNMKTYLM